jgi:hypothetical protein
MRWRRSSTPTTTAESLNADSGITAWTTFYSGPYRLIGTRLKAAQSKIKDPKTVEAIKTFYGQSELLDHALNSGTFNGQEAIRLTAVSIRNLKLALQA